MFNIKTKNGDKTRGKAIAARLMSNLPVGRDSRLETVADYNGDWTAWAVTILTNEEFDETAEITWDI